MWSRTIIGVCAALALAACASAPPAVPTASAKKPPLGCVSDTATRLPIPASECAGFGSTYTKEDLDRTGQVYVQDALRTLDPTITTRP